MHNSHKVSKIINRDILPLYRNQKSKEKFLFYRKLVKVIVVIDRHIKVIIIILIEYHNKVLDSLSEV